MYAHMLAVYAYALLLTLCSVYIPYHDSKKLPCKVAKKTNNVWAALFSLTNIIYLYTNTQLRWISCVEVSATESQLVHNTVARSHLGFPANLREQNTKKLCSHIRTKLGALRPPKYLGQKVFLQPFWVFLHNSRPPGNSVHKIWQNLRHHLLLLRCGGLVSILASHYACAQGSGSGNRWGEGGGGAQQLVQRPCSQIIHKKAHSE